MRAAVLATALVVACHSPEAPHVDDTKERLHIAELEAKRGASLDELIALANKGDRLALRALGRIGGDKARGALLDALAGSDGEAVAWAAAALGVSVSLDGEPDELVRVTYSRVLGSALARTSHRATVIEAIGRAGDPATSMPVLDDALGGPPDVAEAAAIAIGRFGRRKLKWTRHDKLIALTTSAESRLRYAATYALARELDAGAGMERDAIAAVSRALADRLDHDDDPDVRATAIFGLARWNVVGAHKRALAAALLDRDWRVAVEAVRALAGDHGDDEGRDAMAASLVRHLSGDPREAQVVLEGLRLLAGHADRPVVATALDELASVAGKQPAITGAWIACLVKAARRDLAGVASCPLPDHLRAPVLADVIDAGAGTPSERMAAIAAMLASPDPRVRAAAYDPLASMYGADGVDPDLVVSTLASAIETGDAIAGGNAVDSAAGIIEKVEPARRELLANAIEKRAAREKDPEFEASILGAIAKANLDTTPCRAAFDGPRVIAVAARACMHEPPGPPTAATPPPVDVAAVIGKRVTWHLATSRGDIAIALRPDVAPWAVATIVQLTRAHKYDHLAFHRVVPNFVVQGGDPSETGAGGPDFTLPAEPATLLDGDGYVTGGVGMADAGADSAGSQYFVMHGPAPHLDGRYTWVGAVVSGQKAADSLQIGDRVDSASITVEP